MQRGAVFWSGALAAWLEMLLVAVLCGAVRGKALEPRLGERRANQVGIAAVLVLFAAIMGRFVRLRPVPLDRAELIGLGLLWTALTLVFVILFRRLAPGRDGADPSAGYRIDRGRLWLLVLLELLVAPWLLGGMP